MTILEAIRAAGGGAIQRREWAQAPSDWMDPPPWALMWCPGGCPAIMPREAMNVRYCLTLEEISALDWQVVPAGREGVVAAFVLGLREAADV